MFYNYKYTKLVTGMKSLRNYISEKLIINKNYNNPYSCTPTSFDELRKIIEDRYDTFGPGTEQKPINFNDIDISNIYSFCNNMGIGLFEETEFEYIDISKWGVSSVKNMNCTFFKCMQLKSVGDLSNWDVSKIEGMSYMFYYCEQLKSVEDLSNWNVSKVEDMSYMFCDCHNLKSVGDLSNWNVSNVENMHYMFESCEKLKSVGDLSNWNVSKVKDMNGMFFNCKITKTPDWYKKV